MDDNSDDLLDQWLNFNADEDEVKQEGSIPKAPLSDSYPLSPTQQRLWLVYQKNPRSPVYNYAEIWTFEADAFDEIRFKNAFKALVSKHEVLASNYQLRGENPRMTLRNESDFEWIEGAGFDAQSGARAWLKTQASRSFRLESDPLVRLAKCQLPEGRIQVGVTFHHMIIDAWSIDLLRKDFATFYLAGLDETSAKGESLCYQDYSVWLESEEDARVSESPEKQINPGVLDLPLDFPRPAFPSYRGKFLRFSLPSPLIAAVNPLLQKLQTTSFNLFLTTFQILLARYAKSNQVWIGIPVLNREEEELKTIVGYFVDTQVVGGKLLPDQTFVELLAKIKTEVLQSISSEKESYEQLLAKNKQQDQSSNPLFQVMFVGHSGGGNPFEENGLPGLSLEVLDLDVSKFDLTFHHFGEINGQYEIGIEISEDLFTESFAERLVAHFGALLAQIAKNPNLAVSAYSLISEEERRSLIQGFNPHFRSEYQGTVLEDILHNLQTKGPEIAVASGDQKLSYASLDQKSALLAAELNRLGVNRKKPLGIYLDRSVDFLVAMLAVLRYGGYYLPLDPEYPDQRILQYLQESGAEFVLSESQTLSAKSELTAAAQFVNIDLIEANQNIDFEVDKIYPKGEFAYIIFTSGSTSKPKGVRISHPNLHASNEARKSFYVTAPSAFLLVSSFSFDSSVAGIFWSLSTGGKLVISQNKEALDAQALAQLIHRERVSHTLMLPSLYQAILESTNLSSSTLKNVIVAGEECPQSLLVTHFEKNSGAKLFNEYGPTEGTVWCTVQELLAHESYRKIPIGLPTQNTLAYVLQPDLSLTPLGLYGELCIAGPGLVNGYLQSEESAGKFVPNPYSERWNTLYRTGDLVRVQADGLLEYLGRIDNQVKIRGHRIELNEIQSLAEKFLGIKSCVGLVLGEDVQRIGLAFLAEKETSGAIDLDLLRSFLQENLPKYMVPEQLIELQTYPLLPNGKVDLQTLASLANAKRQETSALPKAPTTYLERQVAQIWSDVLGVEDLPINQDFNELGGNSLQSIRIIAKCREIGIKVTPEQFLRYSTVQALVNSLNTSPYERPKNLLELEILGVWEEVLEQKLIGVLDSFAKSGGSGQQWSAVEARLNARFEFKNTILMQDSIRGLAEKVNESTSVSTEIRRIIPITTKGSEAPLFCIHSEFYYETVYSQLTRHLPKDYPIFGVLSVSPELVKDALPQSIEEIASLCLRDMKSVQKEGPYRILSYSIGNVVAFEIARQLLKSGEEVQLILIDPPLFFDKSRTFGKKEYKKYLTYLDLWNKPGELLSKVRKKVNKDENQGILIQETGLLKKFILRYQISKINCEALLITTPREFKHTYDWDPLVNLVDHERIDGPHLKLMREPYSSQMNNAITRNLRRWDQKSKK